MEALPYISSVFIFDRNDNKYGQEQYKVQKLRISSIKEAPWYNEVVEKKGKYIIKFNADQIFEYFDPSHKENYISLIRVIKDIDTQKPIGFFIVNISESALSKYYSDVFSKYDSSISIKDKENNEMVAKKTLDTPDVNDFVIYYQANYHPD